MKLPQKIEALYQSVAWEIRDQEEDEDVAEDVEYEFRRAIEKAYSGDKKAFSKVMRIVQTYEPFYELDTEESEAIELLREKAERGKK